MRTFAILIFLCIVMKVSGQRECVTKVYTETLRKDKTTAARMDAAERFITQQSRNFISGMSGTKTKEKLVIRIPVVVHVLYNTDAQNISDAQINSGIAALN